MSKFTLKVDNFQAVSIANIELKGITVLTGNNSTGKSTLSKLLYYTLKTALEYEENEYSRLFRLQNEILIKVSRLMYDYSLLNDKNIFDIWRNGASPSGDSVGKNSEIFDALFFEVKELFIEWESKSVGIDYKRISAALSMSYPIKMNRQYDSFSELFDMLYNQVVELKKSVIKNIKDRPLGYLEAQLNSYFGAQFGGFLGLKGLPVHLYEEDTSIIDIDNNRLNNIFSIDKVFYNDTPISISFPSRDLGFSADFKTHHWDYLRRAITEASDIVLTDEQKDVNNIISDIISGKVSLEDNRFTKSFTYTRSSDNLSIDLSDSATGIMSFAIIQLLLSKGLLDSNTLLILDEPEAHLHPQWIVEYARVLIILNQKLGVKFMLASHNPDMISALRYISEKEGSLNDIRFYLSEKDGDSNRYVYRDLDVDIEPIFESFNIALDRISEYGI